MSVVIYHNPRCSKSRITLGLLEEKGVEVEVIDYLKNEPDAATLSNILDLLGMEPQDLMRKGEAIYKELGLKNVSARDQLIKAMVDNPILIERPIVVANGKAKIGRPPESVLDIL